MSRKLTLIFSLFLVTVSVCAVNARAISINHKTKPDTLIHLNTDSVSAGNLLQFAQSLIGTRYRPASSDPERGFDCSGFVSYVFKNFNFNVPRSSCEFVNVGQKIRFEDAKPGDIILFTGTKTYHRHRVGHIGIVVSNDGDDFKFIHSTSGKEYAVTITTMDKIYRRRFVQIVRLLKQNDDQPVFAQANQ